MDRLLEQLSEVLARDLGVYRELLEAARSQQRAIIHGKLKELRHAIEAGRQAYLAGRIPKKLYATASSPMTGTIASHG